MLEQRFLSSMKLKARGEISNTGDSPVDEDKGDGCHGENLSSQQSEEVASSFKSFLSLRKR